MRHCIFLCLLLAVQYSLYASQEELVTLTSVDVQGSVENAGVARIQIKSSESGISSVIVSAFGRSITFSKDDLTKLKDFRCSNVTISCETGYKSTGGFCVYFILKNRPYYIGDPFDNPPNSKRIAESVRITLKENEKFSIERKITETTEEGVGGNSPQKEPNSKK